MPVVAPAPGSTVPLSLRTPVGSGARGGFVGSPVVPPPVVIPSAPAALPGTEWALRLAEMSGALVMDLTRAWPVDITDELNVAMGAKFTISTEDPQASSIALPYVVQFWESGTLRFVGFPVRKSSDMTTTTWECLDALWVLGQRTIGKARTNYAVNGSFSADAVGTFPPTGWTANGITSPNGATVANNAHSYDEQAEVLSLQMNNSTAGGDVYVEQRIGLPTLQVGTTYVIAVRAYNRSDKWVGPAFSSRGLYADVLDSAGNVIAGSPVSASIDSSTPLDDWFDLQVAVGIPTNAAQLRYRLYSPGAWVVFDEVWTVLGESSTFVNTDQTKIAERLVALAQSAGMLKSNVNMAQSCPASGVLRTRSYQFDQHVVVLQALQELASLDNGFDFAAVPTTSGWTFTTYFPSRGTYQGGIPLTLVAGGSSNTLLEFSDNVDATETATAVAMLGGGSGPAREEQWVIDADSLGGLILERVEMAPNGTVISDLRPKAKQALARRKRPLDVLQVTGKAALLTGLSVGDTAPVTITWGCVNVAATMRVVRMRRQCQEKRIVLDLNVAV